MACLAVVPVLLHLGCSPHETFSDGLYFVRSSSIRWSKCRMVLNGAANGSMGKGGRLFAVGMQIVACGNACSSGNSDRYRWGGVSSTLVAITGLGFSQAGSAMHPRRAA